VKAMQGLSALKSSEDWVYSDRLQRQAADLWKEALAKLREPPKKNRKEAEAAPEAAGQDKSKEKDLSNVLRYVQEMENDDKSRSQTPGAKGKGGEERPW
jgi:hypothetical protein